MKDIKHFGLRIDSDLLQRFRYVCEYDGRSANGKILFMIRQCIAEFEAENGKIELEEDLVQK